MAPGAKIFAIEEGREEETELSFLINTALMKMVVDRPDVRNSDRSTNFTLHSRGGGRRVSCRVFDSNAEIISRAMINIMIPRVLLPPLSGYSILTRAIIGASPLFRLVYAEFLATVRRTHAPKHPSYARGGGGGGSVSRRWKLNSWPGSGISGGLGTPSTPRMQPISTRVGSVRCSRPPPSWPGRGRHVSYGLFDVSFHLFLLIRTRAFRKKKTRSFLNVGTFEFKIVRNNITITAFDYTNYKIEIIKKKKNKQE